MQFGHNFAGISPSLYSKLKVIISVDVSAPVCRRVSSLAVPVCLMNNQNRWSWSLKEHHLWVAGHVGM